MQVVDGQPAAGVRVRRSFHAVLAVEHGKHDLADVGARSDQRALAQRLRQVIQEAVHDAKDFFSGALIVRDLHAERSFASDAVDEEARSNIGGDAQLARLENDVALGAGGLQILLGAVEDEFLEASVLVADFQQAPHQVLTPGGGFGRGLLGADPAIERGFLVEMAAAPLQAFRAHAARRAQNLA